MSVATCIAEKNKVKEVTIIDKDGRWEADAKLDIFGDELLKPGAKRQISFRGAQSERVQIEMRY